MDRVSVFDPRTQAHGQVVPIRQDVHGMVAGGQTLTLEGCEEPPAIEQALGYPRQYRSEMMQVMVGIDLECERCLEQRYPLTIHRLVVVQLPEIAEHVSEPAAPAHDYFQLQHVSADLNHGRA